MSDSDAIVAMIRAGGVYYNVCGNTPCEVFHDAVAALNRPDCVDPERLAVELCEREGLMTTSIGFGIALPHPRTNLVSSAADQRIYCCFLDKPVNFDAMDGLPVTVLFIILSVNPKVHLDILSRLSWLLQQEDFLTLLQHKPEVDELVAEVDRHLSSQG